MSLVAYDASSDEESDDETPKAIIIAGDSVAKTPKEVESGNGIISDEDDDFTSHIEEKEIESFSCLSQLLPKPKYDTNIAEMFENLPKPAFCALPSPKTIAAQVDIVEDDDEFLHMKPNTEIIEIPKKNNELKKFPVKITIPSLENFRDVEKELADKAKTKSVTSLSKSSVSSGLLSILPKAKSEQNCATNYITFSEDSKAVNTTIGVKAVPCFVPDTVRHKRPATNTEDVDRRKETKKKVHNKIKTSTQDIKNADSDESDDNISTGDFFSFNSEQILPNVSSTEINALVAKKAAKIAETSTNFMKVIESPKFNDAEQIQTDEHELKSFRKCYHQEQHLNSEALQVLVGGNKKRRRQQQSDIQVIDINSLEVLPSKDEWMRTALASSTTYQPTGVLVDEEPASGTRRKHQITYLAHKAKANEAELQAMWAANRQNRRATQSKYGF